MRELRRHQRESPASPFVFVSERGAPLSAPGFSRLIERAADAVDLGIKAHAHMLRHACGYKLANDGHDTRAIQAYLAIAIFRIRRAIPRQRRSGLRSSSEIDNRYRESKNNTKLQCRTLNDRLGITLLTI
jgi:integrase